jgi:hypothetical protein
MSLKPVVKWKMKPLPRLIGSLSFVGFSDKLHLLEISERYFWILNGMKTVSRNMQETQMPL